LALRAAETGCLVLGTLHTDSAGKAINRIIDALPDRSQDQVRATLSVLLRAVISQRLIKRASGEGRVAAVEVLLQNWAMGHMIRENKTHQLDGLLLSPDSEAMGMIHLDQCLAKYVRQGLIDKIDAIRFARYPEEMKKKFIGFVEEEL
jgi:twitching motility protein PilT